MTTDEKPAVEDDGVADLPDKDDGFVDLGDEEQILVNLHNLIEPAYEQLGAGASYAEGGSHFPDDRLELIVVTRMGK